jgi:anaerobic selenocysteine-containing dehydrogenase
VGAPVGLRHLPLLTATEKEDSMSESISRRKFLKLTGLGAAATVLTGCGPAARYVVRRPYFDMPEYGQVGKSTYFATTCAECPAGCGLIVRTFEGRAIKAEGNPSHPVNRGKLCSRGLVGVQGLYNPDRIQAPGQRTRRGEATLAKLEWDAALEVVSQALNAGGEGVAFYLGLAPDHLYDLVSELCQAIGAPAPLRYSALGMFDGRATLAEASRQVYGVTGLPYFDLGGSDLVLSFGANFLETWLSPVSYTRAFSQFRRSAPPQKGRGYLISFEARRSQTSGVADEWYPLVPGSEGQVAEALTSLLGEKGWGNLGEIAHADVDAAASAAGLTREQLEHVADLVVAAAHPLFLPGGNAAGHAGGLAVARAILAMNQAAGNQGQPGGVYPGATPTDEASLGFSTASDVQALVARMNAGQVKTLFVHGANPVFDLPAGLGFREALANVPQVISFASFPDETAEMSDYVLPDHTPLEAWGYQRILAGADRPVYAGLQPVVVPLYDTRATADVLLAAGKLPYHDEVDFLQQKLAPLLNVAGGTVEAGEIATFWTRYLQLGGWWTAEAQPGAAASSEAAAEPLAGLQPVTPAADGQFHLVAFPTQLGDGSGANRPWLQETPNPSTTVTWNTWLEVNPATADALGLKDDDVVMVKSAVGQLEAVVYRFPAIRPDTVAMPFGQGHTALGRWAEGRGANPAELLGSQANEAGDLAFADTLVTITPTGKRRPLSRIESQVGVYGEE